ncbi:hypothetical protein TrLO_g6404 [Triparma laevis f. longispina]|uniref:Uncharacterized protein n=1 Tax=Triparma laevis f. longispina TaxID=1714387 RepID=A0A9W7DT99_9STRA|nr:hypothetical protein TrLO_g6404 [Triparma laevis f. longispina]
MMNADPRPSPERQVRQRIIVPSRMVQFGLDEKFESDPYDIDLKSILTPSEYTQHVDTLNEALKPARPKTLDQAVFYGMGTVIFTAPCAYIVYKRKKKRKKLLFEAISRFNAANPNLFMRWNRRPDSFISIERRTSQHVASKSAPNYMTGGGGDQTRELSVSDIRGGGKTAFDMKPMIVGGANKI